MFGRRTGNRSGTPAPGMGTIVLAVVPIVAAAILLGWGIVREAVLPPIFKGSRIPTANPDASFEARAVLGLLYEIGGRYTLSGQHNYLEAPGKHTARVRDLTGRVPAVIGFELGAIMDYDKEDAHRYRIRVVEEAIRADRAGSLVVITYHAAFPGECECWEAVHTGVISGETFAEIVTEGTRLHEEWLADIDEAAHYLKILRDARVPVLWRPYHEMNGGWFWWGKKSRFADLWNIMFDRYTRHHGLDNLLWVWNPNAPNAYADPYDRYYPGHDKVDILAADIYDNDYKQSHHDQLVKLGGGKPVAIGENGELPNPGLLQTSQPGWTWFMTWGKMLRENNRDNTIRAVYAHPYVLTRDEIDPRPFPEPAEPEEPAEPGPVEPEEPGGPEEPGEPP
ncbi:MAG: hypothetical protein BAA02_00010 [Paenibacillaceae bacterium ZCTH02-B3]|nr:MAG: hypothetical protein BAA02_00010 [Paenibacillaceae bacterium ZCTH02-B3]